MDNPNEFEFRRGWTLERLQARILEIFAMRAEVSLHTLLVGSELDSLDLVEIYMDLEEDFDVVLADERMQHLKTVEDVVEFIWGQLAPAELSPSPGRVDPTLPWTTRAQLLGTIYQVHMGHVETESDFWISVVELLIPAVRDQLAKDLGVGREQVALIFRSTVSR